MKKLISILMSIAMLLSIFAIDSAADTGNEKLSEAGRPKGDVNNDGNTDATDIIIIKRHLLSITVLNGDMLLNADVDSNGKVDATDYIIVKRIMLGLDEEEQEQQSEFIGRAFIIFNGDTAESGTVKYNAGDD